MTDDQPTQPLTDAELSALRNYIERTNHVDNLRGDARRLLEEVDRLRTEVESYKSAICFETTCTGCAGMLDQLVRADAETARLRAENTAQAEQLAAGEASDGYHTHNELYEYRMLYNAHAAIGWLDAGYRVVKSWHHSDGELCFGGGWFVVVAELPTGQVTNHYEADHWELFVIPEETPPTYDGHSPTTAAHRLRQALGWGGDPVDS